MSVCVVKAYNDDGSVPESGLRLLVGCNGKEPTLCFDQAQREP